MTAFLGNILGTLLRFVYDIISTMGPETEQLSYYAMAIIVTTIIFKLLLLPINLQQVKSTRQMNELQPQMKEIQNKYKNDPQTQQAKLQELYKTNNYKPAGSCLILILQMPIIFTFFAVFRDPAKYAFTEPGFYEAMNKGFLWITNLDLPDPNLWGLPLLAALTTYVQSVIMVPKGANVDPQTQATQKTMNYFLPVMIFLSARGFAGGLALYWVIGNIFTIIQQLISNRSLNRVKEEK